MDDVVKEMSNKQLASNLYELAADYEEGYTGQAVEYERDLIREAARRIAETRDEASEGKKRYTGVMLCCGATILLEGKLEQYRYALEDSNGEDTLISGVDEYGRMNCIRSSAIVALYDYGEHKPTDFGY